MDLEQLAHRDVVSAARLGQAGHGASVVAAAVRSGAEKYATKGAAFAEKNRESAIRRRRWFFARYGWSDLDDVRLIRARAERAVLDSRHWAA
ncbi:hypothetical protein [Terrabacter terrae]|uniref:hypothetical protein n=1 Tax=Terrabacter terrae TaxID=318434 RepID=UPI0031D8D8B6